MKKQITVFIAFSILITNVFCQDYKKQFIKGSIADKTSAVREASGKEGIWLSQKAIDFVLENNEIIGTSKQVIRI